MFYRSPKKFFVKRINIFQDAISTLSRFIAILILKLYFFQTKYYFLQAYYFERNVKGALKRIYKRYAMQLPHFQLMQ